MVIGRWQEIAREAEIAVQSLVDSPEGYGKVTILIRNHEPHGIAVEGYRPLQKPKTSTR